MQKGIITSSEIYHKKYQTRKQFLLINIAGRLLTNEATFIMCAPTMPYYPLLMKVVQLPP